MSQQWEGQRSGASSERRSTRLARALAAGVATVAVLTTLSGFAMPVPEWQAPLPLILARLALLLLHAALYARGPRLRATVGLTGYAGAQAAALFALALARPPAPLTIALYVTAVAELVTLAGSAWGTVRITLGAVTLLVLASLITADLYRAATDGVILATAALIAHAFAALLRRPAVEPPRAPANGPAALSAREADVLRELVRGARNSDIAATLGITERTVKAHLGSIYQKLGVTSRAAAVAAAMQGRLV
jgi:DNA-binding CsgD family transcriptional regulator